MDSKTIFRQNITALREYNEYSTYYISKHTPLSLHYLLKLDSPTGLIRPKLYVFESLAKFYNIPVNLLLDANLTDMLKSSQRLPPFDHQMNLCNVLAENFKKQRTDKNLDVYKLSKLSLVDYRTLLKLEDNLLLKNMYLSFDTFDHLAALYNIPVSDFFKKP